MLNMGGGELFVVALVALLLIPNEKIPELAHKLGRLVAQLQNGFQDFKSGLQKNLQKDLASDPPKVTDSKKP